MFSYLLLNANKVVSTHELIEALWGGAEPATARTQVQGDISALRRAWRGLGHAIPLISKKPGYAMHVRSGELDLEVFRNHIDKGREENARGEFDSALSSIRSGLALWQGAALSDIDVSFAESARAQLTELRLNAYVLLADIECARGNHVALAQELMPLIDAYPLHEELRRKLILALYRSGRQAKALECAREFRSKLAEEQGLIPGRALAELEEAMLRADPALDLPAPAPITILPRAPRHPVTPAQLPPALIDFVGRKDLLEEIDAAARDEHSKWNDVAPTVITVVGPAGSGKTALATLWARSRADQFPDGQLFIDLRGYSTGLPVTPTEALSRFVRALGVAADATPTDLDELISFYRSMTAGKRLLFLVDNARSSEQVRSLLSASPGSLTLITSRSRMTGLVAREGARRVSVGPLSATDAEILLAQIIGAGRLHAEPAAWRELVQACGSLPLALRIAAANLVNHPHQRIADYIRSLETGNRLAALETSGDKPTALQHVFDQSFAAMPPDIQPVFLLLGLIPGPDFTMPAVAALAPTAPLQTQKILDYLLDTHLIEESAEDRYSLHDMVRLYVRSRVQTDVTLALRLAARHRLFDWYLAQAAAAVDQIFPQRLRLPPVVPIATPVSATNDGCLAWLDAEYPNLLAVLHTAENGAYTWNLADTLRLYFHTRNAISDWVSAASAAIYAAREAENPDAEFSGHFSLAQAYLRQADYPMALKNFEIALRLARHVDIPGAAHNCESSIGLVLADTGRLDQAVRRLQRLDSAERSAGALSAETLSHLGMAYLGLGRLKEANDALLEALEIAQKSSSANEVYALANLGLAAHALGDLERAESLFTEAVAALHTLGDLDVESACLSELAAVHLDAGRMAAARECAEQAWSLACTVEKSNWILPVLSMLATTRQSLSDHRQAIGLSSTNGNPGVRAKALLAAARTAIELGKRDLAHRDAQDALTLAAACGYRAIEGDCLIVLAEAEPAGSDSAVFYARQALAIHTSTGHRIGTKRAEKVLVRVLSE